MMLFSIPVLKFSASSVLSVVKRSSLRRSFSVVPVVSVVMALVLVSCGEAIPSTPAVSPSFASDTATLPGNSLHHLPHSWADARGTAWSLARFRGTPVVLGMFYASCKSVCPRTLNGLRAVQEALSPEARSRTRFVLVSLDPVHDTPAVLARVAADYSLDDAWTLAVGTEEATRELAAVLAIRYRAESGGEIGHTPVITVLDAEGVPGFVTEDPAGDRDRLVETIVPLSR